MMQISLLVAPSEEPVTLDEAKLAARVDGDEFDLLIPGLITAARSVAEQQTGQRLMPQTWRVEFDDWPGADDLIRLYPLASSSPIAITYWNGATWSVLSTALYAVVRRDFGFVVRPELNAVWPTPADAVGPRVRIDVSLGYADAASVPECAKLYIKAQVAAWLRNPEAIARADMARMPLLDALLDSLKVW